MKSRTIKSVYRVALVSALVLTGAISLSPARDVKAGESASGAEPLADQPASQGGLIDVLDRLKEAQARKLEGTWRVQVTIRDCQTGAALRTFPAMLTFARGGTLTETTTGFGPAQRSPGHGFWRHTDGHTYSVVSEAFLFNPAGAWTGTQKLTQAIEIGDDSDEFASTATIESLRHQRQSADNRLRHRRRASPQMSAAGGR